VKAKLLGQEVAVKICKRSALQSNKTLTQQITEIECLNKLNGNENILGYYGINSARIRNGCIFVFLETCDLGSIDKYLRANRKCFHPLSSMEESKEKMQEEWKSNTLVKVDQDNRGITIGTLLNWTHQICEGMEYIAAKQV